MTRGRIVTAKVFVGIICTVLILGTVFMTTILIIFRNGPNVPYELSDKSYRNIPNVGGDCCVYVSENFFYDNNLYIPGGDDIYFNTYGENGDNWIVNGSRYRNGRVKNLKYSFLTGSNRGGQFDSIIITCNSKNITRLQNQQKHNEYTYGLQVEDYVKDSENGNNTMEYRCEYTINFKRNVNTSKECQLSMIVKISHNKDASAEQFKEVCDELFFSLLDNVVYRNV
ncbi:MAG: hypothetical protein K2L70_06400 [Clostridia bacterium]|nr:hypothetical protein [Clostridia bacterium]